MNENEITTGVVDATFIQAIEKYPLEISFEGRQFVNMDFFSKSDPFIVVYLKKDGILQRISTKSQVKHKTSGRLEAKIINHGSNFVSSLNANLKSKNLLPNSKNNVNNLRQILGTDILDDRINSTASRDSTPVPEKSSSAFPDITRQSEVASESSSSQLSLADAHNVTSIDDKRISLVELPEPTPLNALFKSLDILTLIQYWEELGRSEVIWDDLNPKFVFSVLIVNAAEMYEQDSLIRVEVFDNDSKSSEDLSKHDFIGVMEINFKDLIDNGNQLCKYRLHSAKHKQPGFLMLHLDIRRPLIPPVLFELNIELGNCNQSEVFFSLERSVKKNQWKRVYRSEMIKPKKTTEFPLARDNLEFITAGVTSRLLRFQFFVRISRYNYRVIWFFDFSYDSLLERKVGHFFQLHGTPDLKKLRPQCVLFGKKVDTDKHFFHMKIQNS